MAYKMHGYEVDVYWCEWRREWVAYSDDFDGEGPTGSGKTREEALNDLDWQLEEFNEKWGKKNAAQ